MEVRKKGVVVQMVLPAFVVRLCYLCTVLNRVRARTFGCDRGEYRGGGRGMLNRHNEREAAMARVET